MFSSFTRPGPQPGSQPIAPEDRAFLGTGWSFPPTFDRHTGRVETIVAEADIRQSIEIILTTQPGERLMQPDFGCDLRQFLFVTADAGTIASLKSIVADALLYHDPRIIVNRVDADPRQVPEGILLIEIDYTIRQTNTRTNLVYPFYFREATDV